MEVKINEIQPLMVDPRVLPELSNRKSRVIKPIAKGKGNLSRKVGDDREASKGETAQSETKSDSNQEIAEEVHTCLEDLTGCLRPVINQETGDPVIEVLNPTTGDVVRRIPSADLAKVHRKLEELRGLIFDAKV